MSEEIDPKSYEQQCHIILENFQVRKYVEPVSGKIVKIYEMIHLAPVEFYEARNAEMEEDHLNGFVIHHEGVQGKVGKGLNESYRIIAECLGWDFQKRPEPTPVEIIDVNMDELPFVEQKIFKGVTGSISFIVGKVAHSMKHGSLSSSVEKFRDGILELDTDRKLPIVFDSYLLDKRNKIALKAALSEKRNVSLVWGKAHRKGLEKGLFQAGFQLV